MFVLQIEGMLVYYIMFFLCSRLRVCWCTIPCVVFVLQIAGMMVYYTMCCVCAVDCGCDGLLYHALCLCGRLRVC